MKPFVLPVIRTVFGAVPQRRRHRLAGVLLLTCLVAACGGGSDAPSSAITPTTPVPDTTAPDVTVPTGPQPAVQKALVIDIDGVVFSELQKAIAAKTVPALAALKLAPAFSGGVAGTMTEQPTTGTPGWASLVTGVWLDRHGVRWEAGDQPLQATTVFAQFKEKARAGKAAAVTSNSAYQPLLQADVGAKKIDTAIDCAGVDSCVTRRSRELIAQDYELVFAQFGAVADAAETGGLQGAYQGKLTATAAAIGELLADIAKRQAINPNEDWLVIATTGEGLGRYGNADGLQADLNKTAFIASNKDLANLPGVGLGTPPVGTALYALAAITDIAPTVLRHLGASPTAAMYAMEGQALQTAPSVRPFTNAPGDDRMSIALAWTVTGPVTKNIVLLRDGEPLATLPPDARNYLDTALKGEASGLLTRRYTLVVEGTVLSTRAQISYVKPTPLAATLINKLRSYFALDALPATDSKNVATMGSNAPSVAVGSLVTDDNFGGSWAAKALRVDARIFDATTGATGLRVTSSPDITASAQFTFGFWVRTDATCSQGVSNGSPIIANKNWASGNNVGIAIGLFGSCEIRYNLGSGSARAEISGVSLSPGRWAYMAMVVDRTNLTMTAYLFDPVKGTTNRSIVFTSAVDAGMAGLGRGFSLNEDGTGLYYKTYPVSPRSALDFNELAFWDRALTADELGSIYLSGRPLSTLTP